MIRTVSTAGVLLLALLAGSAQAAVTVIGGGMAQACSQAAIGCESDYKFQQLCTEALDSEFMTARDRAGTLVNRCDRKLRPGNYQEATQNFNQAGNHKHDNDAA